MLFVGLTGGIGTGKSTAARMLAERGAVVIDADLLAREAVAPGTRRVPRGRRGVRSGDRHRRGHARPQAPRPDRLRGPRAPAGVGGHRPPGGAPTDRADRRGQRGHAERRGARLPAPDRDRRPSRRPGDRGDDDDTADGDRAAGRARDGRGRRTRAARGPDAAGGEGSQGRRRPGQRGIDGGPRRPGRRGSGRTCGGGRTTSRVGSSGTAAIIPADEVPCGLLRCRRDAGAPCAHVPRPIRHHRHAPGPPA